MKKIIVIGITIFSINIVFSQNKTIADITTSISKGDAATLSTFFATEIELFIIDDEDLYSKEDARKLLGQFFAKHKPQSFKQVHLGISKGGNSHYFVGNFIAKGRNYKIYIYFQKMENVHRIEEIKIEKK